VRTLPAPLNMNTIAEQQVSLINGEGQRPILLICEHASNFIPASFNGLGLNKQQLQSHIAWDLGALETAEIMARRLDAPLIAAQVSRLVYDCNRPPESPSAIPLNSEKQPIAGNIGLNSEAKKSRVNAYYRPFEAAVNHRIASMEAPLIITIHSFTPVYLGQQRSVEIGALHDTDRRFADAFMRHSEQRQRFIVRRNQPYTPKDGVTHTLKHHAIPRGLNNLMLEIRNDLIATPKQQQEMAAYLADLVELALLETPK